LNDHENCQFRPYNANKNIGVLTTERIDANNDNPKDTLDNLIKLEQKHEFEKLFQEKISKEEEEEFKEPEPFDKNNMDIQ